MRDGVKNEYVRVWSSVNKMRKNGFTGRGDSETVMRIER